MTYLPSSVVAVTRTQGFTLMWQVCHGVHGQQEEAKQLCHSLSLQDVCSSG